MNAAICVLRGVHGCHFVSSEAFMGAISRRPCESNLVATFGPPMLLLKNIFTPPPIGGLLEGEPVLA